MPLSTLMTDKVSLIKQNGERVDNIKASVQPKVILIKGSDIIIESGDYIYRKMSNGGEEIYEVIDPSFHEKLASIPAHYQLKHRKLGIPEAKEAIQTITYNISGANARVNNDSVDNSTNIATIDSDVAEHISMLRQEIQRLVDSEEKKKDGLELVDAIEGQLESGKPSKAVIRTLINSLPAAGSIASIGSFILSFIGA